MHMSKQLAIEDWAPPEWLTLARALYTKMLRDATSEALGGESSASPPKKMQKLAGGGLFRFQNHLSVCTEPTDHPQTNDAVTDEIERWKMIDKVTIQEHTDEEGLLNEMAIMWKLRHSFPLHFRVFKQVSCHLSHEANTEQLFSLAGGLSDNNGKMSPDNLSTWTAVGANMGAYKPSVEHIKERYFKLFSKGGIDVDA